LKSIKRVCCLTAHSAALCATHTLYRTSKLILFLLNRSSARSHATRFVAMGVVLCAAASVHAQSACSAAVAAAVSSVGANSGKSSGSPTAPYCYANATSNSSYPLQLRQPLPGEKEVATVNAVETSGVDNQFFEAQGKVDVRSPFRQVLSDWMRYEFSIDTIKAKGNVVIRSWQDLVTGPELEYKRDTETGFMKSPSFVLGLYKGRGTADELLFTGPEKYRINRGVYSTCVGESPAWHLQVGQLDIDENTSVGIARDARIYLGPLPVAWLPQFSFPLKNERKSGFLAATYGTSGNRGFDLQIPYYLNLAPNYDATITPRIMTKRGVLFNGQARYIFDTPLGTAVGQWDGEILPKDRLANATRDATNIRHTQVFSPNLSLAVNYNHVSDPRYFVDLSDYVSITSLTTLSRDATLTYRNSGWTYIAKAQRFQTLQDPAALVLPPYDRVPQLSAESPEYRPFADKRFELKLSTDVTRFEYPNAALPSGYRGYAYGTLAWKYDTPGVFITPKVGLHATRYDLIGSFDDYRNSTRILPVASIDGGLRFERNASIFGNAFIQTLEPRAMFAFIPYRDQSQTPVFDTALADFNYLQLFSENRYVGQDRIGDTQQLSLGLTSRLLDPDSQKERLRFTVGERFYFNNQRVTLGETARDRNSSDLLFSAQGRITDQLYVEANAQYNANVGQTERYSFGLRYSPERSKTINVNYRAIRELLTLSGPVRVKQVDVAGQWPIYGGIYAVGRVNYSIDDRRLTEGIFGLEFDGCCYVIRAVAQRLATSTTTATNAFFLQLELNGLGRVGSNPLDVLKRNIPGYSLLYENPTRRRLDEPTPMVTDSLFTPWNTTPP
jgi:LPS-assembly protein